MVMLVTFLAFGLAASPALGPAASAKPCARPLADWGRVIIWPGRNDAPPEIDVIIADKHDQNYQALWTVSSRLADAAPQELDFTVESPDGLPPDGSTGVLSLDGKAVATLSDRSFKGPGVGVTESLRAQDGEVVPNIYGHREMSVSIFGPDGALFSSRRYRLPSWPSIESKFQRARTKLVKDVERQKEWCHEPLVVEPW